MAGEANCGLDVPWMAAHDVADLLGEEDDEAREEAAPDAGEDDDLCDMLGD